MGSSQSTIPELGQRTAEKAALEIFESALVSKITMEPEISQNDVY